MVGVYWKWIVMDEYDIKLMVDCVLENVSKLLMLIKLLSFTCFSLLLWPLKYFEKVAIFII